MLLLFRIYYVLLSLQTSVMMCYCECKYSSSNCLKEGWNLWSSR